MNVFFFPQVLLGSWEGPKSQVLQIWSFRVIFHWGFWGSRDFRKHTSLLVDRWNVPIQVHGSRLSDSSTNQSVISLEYGWFNLWIRDSWTNESIESKLDSAWGGRGASTVFDMQSHGVSLWCDSASGVFAALTGAFHSYGCYGYCYILLVLV